MGTPHTWTGLARLFQRNHNIKIHAVMSSIQDFFHMEGHFFSNISVNVKSEDASDWRNKHAF
jgi:hypothetical protein